MGAAAMSLAATDAAAARLFWSWGFSFSCLRLASFEFFAAKDML